MSRSTFAVVIGVVSAVWHFMVAALLFIIGNVFDEVVEEENASEVKDATVDPEKYAAMKEMISDYVMGFLFLGILACIFEIIVSILLVVGVKKQRPHLVAPWVYVTVIALVLQMVNIFVDADDSKDKTEFLEIISCVFYAAIWYPIYRLYKKMVREQKTVMPHTVSSPVNPHYVPYVMSVSDSKTVPLSDFSHSAKYVHAEAKVETVVPAQTMYPEMPAAPVYPTKV
ncbi:uncharacterized protein LOC101888344 [Musca domestica]|uniref:Uncharacterized protein LOC101888344 n=1 Tax=Musca domestica TaxID=7370 RepID=A0A9J7CLZ7_MUSDO|nr:uncharacterized protein LOC101888344 [Musca domestica]